MTTPADPTTRKYHDKEEFVTGHGGTTADEIFILCLVIPIGLHLYYNLHSYHVAWHRDDKSEASGWQLLLLRNNIVIEFLALIVPMLLVQTSLLPYWIGPAALLSGMLTLALMIPSIRKSDNNHPKNNHDSHQKQKRRRPPFLSIHRSCVYILTTIAILAVDFPIFPRRFCKTEVSGYGWMDLGAASFVIIAGWTSALSTATKATVATTTGMMYKAAKKCIPLLVIGLIRLATNKGLEYQEHVSEYGVHWNFFFTLCCVEGFMVAWKGLKCQCKQQLLTIGTNKFLPVDSLLALLMMILYQIYLTSGGGQDFIENGDRRCNDSHLSVLPTWFVSDFPTMCNIFVANREGILGSIGYVSLRLFSEDISRLCILPGEGNGSMKRRLFIMSTLLWATHLCLTMGFQIPTSRRSTNASFLLWSLAHNTSLLYLIHEVVARVPPLENGGKPTPPLLNSVNRYGLAVFLFSNILTGLVNLTVDTLHSSSGKAMVVLSLYLALVCGVALLLDSFFNKRKVD